MTAFGSSHYASTHEVPKGSIIRSLNGSFLLPNYYRVLLLHDGARHPAQGCSSTGTSCRSPAGSCAIARSILDRALSLGLRPVETDGLALLGGLHYLRKKQHTGVLLATAERVTHLGPLGGVSPPSTRPLVGMGIEYRQVNAKNPLGSA